ncbi:unnamed protein product [Phytophthora fragariaefolia]|uniref:Unnamed protein product n=1 Tax=Phytophthora fragariaefolia TaxID=1490495 RepID=A0A9W6Y8N8_9STRA|nr:unnamed protein product [Phytophthora fragariaefolia]
MNGVASGEVLAHARKWQRICSSSADKSPAGAAKNAMGLTLALLLCLSSMQSRSSALARLATTWLSHLLKSPTLHARSSARAFFLGEITRSSSGELLATDTPSRDVGDAASATDETSLSLRLRGDSAGRCTDRGDAGVAVAAVAVLLATGEGMITAAASDLTVSAADAEVAAGNSANWNVSRAELSGAAGRPVAVVRV